MSPGCFGPTSTRPTTGCMTRPTVNWPPGQGMGPAQLRGVLRRLRCRLGDRPARLRRHPRGLRTGQGRLRGGLRGPAPARLAAHPAALDCPTGRIETGSPRSGGFGVFIAPTDLRRCHSREIHLRAGTVGADHHRVGDWADPLPPWHSGNFRVFGERHVFPTTGESSVTVDEQRPARSGLADALVWLGGGDTRRSWSRGSDPRTRWPVSSC